LGFGEESCRVGGLEIVGEFGIIEESCLAEKAQLSLKAIASALYV